MAKSSCRSFCSGVPVKTMRRFVSMQVVSSFQVCVDVFFKRWPSSQINRSKLTDCLKEKGCQNYGEAKKKYRLRNHKGQLEGSVGAVFKTNKWCNAFPFFDASERPSVSLPISPFPAPPSPYSHSKISSNHTSHVQCTNASSADTGTGQNECGSAAARL